MQPEYLTTFIDQFESRAKARAEAPVTMAGRWLLTKATMVAEGEFYASRDSWTTDGAVLLLGADDLGHVAGEFPSGRYTVMRMAMSSGDTLNLCATKHSAQVSNFYFHDYYGTLAIGKTGAAAFTPWKKKARDAA